MKSGTFSSCFFIPPQSPMRTKNRNTPTSATILQTSCSASQNLFPCIRSCKRKFPLLRSRNSFGDSSSTKRRKNFTKRRKKKLKRRFIFLERRSSSEMSVRRKFLSVLCFTESGNMQYEIGGVKKRYFVLCIQRFVLSLRIVSKMERI